MHGKTLAYTSSRMEREPSPERSGKTDRAPLYMKMYFRQEFIEIVRMVGYAGRPLAEARAEMLEMEKRFDKDKLVKAAEDLVDIGGEFVRLKAEARKLAHQLLGPDRQNTTKPEPTTVEPPQKGPDNPPKVKPTRIRSTPGLIAKTQAEVSTPKGHATPMMEQYRIAKEKHPDILLLFRFGDFYELFDTDAEEAAKLLGLTITTRDRAIKMAGFPHHQLEVYLHKLLKVGKRVAICDQVNPDDGKRMKRQITRVVTPAEGNKPAEGKPVKQPRHFVLKKYEERLNAEGVAFLSATDVKKTTPAVVPHIAGLDYIVLAGEKKLLVTVRPNLPKKNADAARAVQKLFGSPYQSVRIWPTDSADGWLWEKHSINPVPEDRDSAENPA